MDKAHELRGMSKDGLLIYRGENLKGAKVTGGAASKIASTIQQGKTNKAFTKLLRTLVKILFMFPLLFQLFHMIRMHSITEHPDLRSLETIGDSRTSMDTTNVGNMKGESDLQL